MHTYFDADSKPQGGEGLEKLKGTTITAPAVLERE